MAVTPPLGARGAELFRDLLERAFYRSKVVLLESLPTRRSLVSILGSFVRVNRLWINRIIRIDKPNESRFEFAFNAFTSIIRSLIATIFGASLRLLFAHFTTFGRTPPSHDLQSTSARLIAAAAMVPTRTGDSSRDG